MAPVRTAAAGAPPAAASSAARPSQTIWTVVHAPMNRRERRRQAGALTAALPADALAALPSAAAAAATASLLTAMWLQRTGNSAEAAHYPEANGEEHMQDAAAAVPDPPSSAEGIWAAAWQGFAPPPAVQHQQQQPGVDASNTGISAAGQQNGASGAPQLGQQQQQQPEQESPLSEDGKLRMPVLLLQGIRSSERSRLLALCLAALEAQVAALPAGTALLAPSGHWSQLSAALLALSSLAAAAAWLGYVPAQLVISAAKQLVAVDTSVLQAAGVEAAAAALQQQAVAAAAASGSSGDEDSVSQGTAVHWYCLEEKVQLYSSVLRLLSCTSIEQQQQQQAAELGLPPAALPGAADDVGSAAADALVSGSQGPLAVRQQAQALLQQQQLSGRAPGAIRGWRATAGGARSNTQLLALAPSVLQDMAVTAADAVAAAYLADAAAAGPGLAAAAATAGTAVDAAAAGSQKQRSAGQRSNSGLQAWFSRAGSGSSGGSSDSSSSAPAALAAAADASGSVDPGTGGSSEPLEAGWWPTFVHPQLSTTRQLQRFANSVAVRRWVHRQYRGVADIYEDRLRLWGIAGSGRRLEPCSAPLKRTPELGQLKGLRYAASLLLEAADLLSPLLRTLWAQATAAASWLLVQLVGRAVALVRRGVKQGMGQPGTEGQQWQDGGPKQQRKQQQQQNGAGLRRRQQRRQQAAEDGGLGGFAPGWGWQG